MESKQSVDKMNDETKVTSFKQVSSLISKELHNKTEYTKVEFFTFLSVWFRIGSCVFFFVVLAFYGLWLKIFMKFAWQEWNSLKYRIFSWILIQRWRKCPTIFHWARSSIFHSDKMVLLLYLLIVIGMSYAVKVNITKYISVLKKSLAQWTFFHIYRKRNTHRRE